MMSEMMQDFYARTLRWRVALPAVNEIYQIHGFLVICLMLCSTFGFAQEICDNGVDDDGDGLVDIYDPDCECIGVNTYMDLTSYIPSPDLEAKSCCPMGVSEMNCVDAWEPGTNATTDYNHTCGFVMPAVVDAGLVPFPSGNGSLGCYIYEGYREYAGVCLNDPLETGVEYTFRVYVAATVLGTNCDPVNFSFDPLELTLFGHSSCALPANTFNCPTDADPNWVALGHVVYNPTATWIQVDITFTPTEDINGIMIGAPCDLPSDYEEGDCNVYLLYDDFSLAGGTELADLMLTDLGLSCEQDYSLIGEVNHNGGTWQWYFNGAALPGQNESAFFIADNNFISGIYAVTYSTPDGCVIDSIQVNVPVQEPNVEEVFFCPNSEVDCAGETFSVPGIYDVHLIGPNGCDSVVTCVVEEFDLPPVTSLIIDTCGPVAIEVCNEIYTETGVYEIQCSDWRGCDSVIILDLRVMKPVTIIQPPGQLECDSTATVILNGLGSSFNLINSGSTEFLWEGPPDGFVGPIDEANTLVNKPGKYCLTVIHESNGVICTDSSCVVVTSSSELPGPPVIQGVHELCLGDTLILQPNLSGGAPATGFEWSFDPALDIVLKNDDLQFVPAGPGVAQICLSAFNECGSSDSVCIQIQTSAGDTTYFQTQTCDPALAGMDTLLLQNQFGCDSLSIIERILVPAIEVILPSTTCDPLLAGVDTVIYQTSGGCDSLVITQRTLLPSSQSNIQNATCDPALVGVDTILYQNQFGCDSLVITKTDLLPSNAINQTVYTCDPAQAGLDTLILTNQYGCDSILYIERIYSGNYQETNQALICSAGVNYTDTLLVTSGPCDSLFITNYKYVALDTTWLTAASCDPAQAGISIVVQPSSLGCDSTIVTTTSLSPTDSILLSGVTCDPSGAMYFVSVLSNQFGCDSIVTTDIKYVGIDTLYVAKTTCEPSQVGTIVSVLPGVDCDTVLVTETIYVPFTQSEETIILCGQTGILSDTTYLQNSAGCDSLAIRFYEYVSLNSQFQIQGETCAGNQDGHIEIKNISGGQAPFELQLNAGGWQSATVFTDLSPGQYTILIRDAAGCLDTLSGLVIMPGATVAIDAGPDRIAASGEVIDLSAQTTQSLSQVQWTASDPLSCPTCLQTTLGPMTTHQTVVVTAWTTEGCSDSDALEVIIKTKGNVFIPNSFTPNNDGINDVFSIYGNDQIRSIRNLAIFDRWGNSLYSRSDLPIYDPSAGWDGTFRDDVMDPGVYIYVVEVELNDGSVKLYKGDVTLTR